MIEEERINFFNQVALFLERYSWEDFSNYAKKIREDKVLYPLFVEGMVENFIFIRLSDHKIKLAKIILQSAGVKALESDRTRVVWLLSRYYNSAFKAAVDAFKTEFGPYFCLQETYQVGQKQYSWKKLAQKAREIKNGHKNYYYYQTLPFVDEFLDFYKLFDISDPKTLVSLVQLGNQITPNTVKNKNLPSDSRNSEIMKKISEFYKLCGRLAVDTQSLSSELSFDKMNDFITNVVLACQVRLSLQGKSLKNDDYDTARMILLDTFSVMYSDRFTGDELTRLKVQLEPAGGKNV